jgi:galactokinase
LLEGWKRVSADRSRWWAPGRVNLIGEHTDYNAGFALPFAIERGCSATVERTDLVDVVAVSAQQPGPATARLDALDQTPPGWARYVFGVVWAIQQRGVQVPGLRIVVDSEVPGGAGLSSSAALICSVATAANEVLALDLGSDDLLAITRSAENDFVGAPTGGLDQLAALRCTGGHALLCDMRSLEVRQVPFDLVAAGLTMLVIDTRSHHEHATGEYRARRTGCEEAARQLGVSALRDIELAGLDDALERLSDDTLRRYTRHIVTENNRVLQTAALLDRGEITAIGQLLSASHESLRTDFRVTVDELDVAVTAALGAGAYGARMTGGGFGGSVIALLDMDRVASCEQAVRTAFASRGFAEPSAFTARAVSGAESRQ